MQYKNVTTQQSRHEILRNLFFILTEVSKKNIEKSVFHIWAGVLENAFTNTNHFVYFLIFSKEDSLRKKQQNTYVHDKPCAASLRSNSLQNVHVTHFTGEH